LGVLIILLEVPIRKEYLTFIKVGLPILGITYFVLGLISSSIFLDNIQFIIYSLAISIFLHALQNRNPEINTKVLGLTLMMTNLFSQYWEAPLFAYAHLGLPGFKYLGSMDQIYLLLVFYLTLKFANISMDIGTVLYLSIPLIATILVFMYRPVIIYYVDPLWFTVRCISCFCLGKVFIERGTLE